VLLGSRTCELISYEHLHFYAHVLKLWIDEPDLDYLVSDADGRAGRQPL
jgi:hypothetical protein